MVGVNEVGGVMLGGGWGVVYSRMEWKVGFIFTQIAAQAS